MSTLPENELDLEKLFLPAWAQGPATTKKYANFEGREERPDRRGDRQGGRPPRRDGPPGDRPRGNRPQGDRSGPRREGGKPSFGDRPRFDRGEPQRRETPPPLPEINVALLPDEKGVESLARQIKMTGRAYPLFDIARLILQKHERYSVTFSVKKKADGQIAQQLFLCALDDTLWLSEAEAIDHVLKKHFATFYQAECTATEPPKGTYTFVGQCSLSGTILGPPNHHDYQNQLRKLHADRFSRMPFEEFKSRVRIVRDEAVVKKWVEDQSWKTEFVCLNVPEPLRLGNREAVEKHFRETHKETIIKPVESHTLNGAIVRGLRSAGLIAVVREAWEEQRRFPLQIATTLSQQFAGQGLQFFKVNKTVTHVSVARPHFLDLETTPVSDGVKRIVEFVDSHPKTTRRKLMEALAPTPAAAPVPIPVGEEAAKTPAQPAPAEPTPEQTALIGDLHWLIHQGHVIEFANGMIETAKKPLPKPPKPEKKSAAKPAEAATATETTPATENTEPGQAPSEADLKNESSESSLAPQSEEAGAEPANGIAETSAASPQSNS
ncbi:MAG: hypothetical protein QOD03_1431 [Verrucomicrobiota bacterium]|jgi:hypothetical protein